MDLEALVVVSVCALFYYRAGRVERSWGILWAALSIAISILVLEFLHYGVFAVFAGQLLLFVAITVYRVWRSR